MLSVHKPVMDQQLTVSALFCKGNSGWLNSKKPCVWSLPTVCVPSGASAAVKSAMQLQWHGCVKYVTTVLGCHINIDPSPNINTLKYERLLNISALIISIRTFENLEICNRIFLADFQCLISLAVCKVALKGSTKSALLQYSICTRGFTYADLCVIILPLPVCGFLTW